MNLSLSKSLVRKDLRIVVTSATMDEELFANYFQAPIFKVEGRLHGVEVPINMYLILGDIRTILSY